MTELEQQLTDELGKPAGQYAQEQKRLAGQVKSFVEGLQQLADHYEQVGERARQLREATRRATAADGQTCDEVDQPIRRSFGRFERALSVIHAEAQQERKGGDRRDRVEGRIESLIQGRMLAASIWD